MKATFINQNTNKLCFALAICAIFLLPDTIYGQNNQQKAWLENKANDTNSFVRFPFSWLTKLADGYDSKIEHPGNGDVRVPIKVTNNCITAEMDNIRPALSSTPGSFLPDTLEGEGQYILLVDAYRPINNHKDFLTNNVTRLLIPDQYFLKIGWDQDLKKNFGDKEFIEYNSIGKVYCNEHATACAGTLIGNGYSGGVNLTTKGMAPKGKVVFLNWFMATSKISKYALQGAKVVCVPYGYWTGWGKDGETYIWGEGEAKTDYKFGYYSKITQEWDLLANNAPYLLIVKSAGNDNGDKAPTSGRYAFWDNSTQIWDTKEYSSETVPDKDGKDGAVTLSDIALAKNVLTIGALNNSGNAVATLSSNGPTNDYRIKPELVARGENINTTGQFNTEDPVVNLQNGTSFSAPAVAGGVALLNEYLRGANTNFYKNKEILLSSTMKALLVNTADDIGAEGPDVFSGYGKPNFKRAFDLINNNITNKRQIDEFLFTDKDQVVSFKVKKKTNQKLTATICWNDPAPANIVSVENAKNGTNKDLSMLVHNYDLVITSGGITYKPWSYDKVLKKIEKKANDYDNLEQIDIDASAAAQEYEVKISLNTASKATFNGYQVVSLVISGIENLSSTETITTDLSTPNQVITTETTTEIISSKSITGGAGRTFVTGESIKLNTGFKVSAGSVFKAILSENIYSRYGQSYPFIDFTCNISNIPSNDKSGKINNPSTEPADEEILRGISVFPNPSADFIKLKSQNAEMESITVYNLNGQMIYKANKIKSAETTINIQSWPKGMYIVRMNFGTYIENRSFIKK